MPSPSLSAWVMMLFVAIGGALGALIRNYTHVHLSSYAWPNGLTGINIVGSLLAGLVLGLTINTPLSDTWRAFLVVGVFGAMTTMSGFAVEMVVLVRDQYYLRALLHGVGGTTLCVAAAWIGTLIGSSVLRT